MNVRLRWFRVGSPKVVGVLLALVLLCGFVGFVFGGLVSVPNVSVSPTVDAPYVLETPFSGWDFYVGQYSNGSVYAVNGSNWDNFVVSVDDEYVFNLVFANCSDGLPIKKVVAVGDFSIDDSLVLNGYTWFELVGSVTATPVDSNFAMVKNSDQSDGNDFITVEGGYWNGNITATVLTNTAANMFEFIGAGSGSDGVCQGIVVRDLYWNGAGADVLHLDNVQGRFCSVQNDKRGGVGFLKTVGRGLYYVGTDSFFSDMELQSLNMEAVYVGYAQNCHFDNIYAGGGATAGNPYLVFLQYAKECVFNGLRVDSSEHNGLYLNNGDEFGFNEFSNLEVTKPNNGGHNGIVLEGTRGNMFVNVFVGNRNFPASVNWTVGILEVGASGCDGNIFRNVVLNNCSTLVSLDGASSLCGVDYGV